MTPQPSRKLVVDSRWSGKHGIARYSTEVLSRLSLDRRELSSPFSPTSPLDVLSPGRWKLSPHDVIYSPGFNAGYTRAQQILTVHDLIHLQDSSEVSAMKHRYYENIVKPAIHKSRAVFTVSETSAEDIKNWINDDRVSVTVTGCGISPEFTHKGTQDPRGEGKFLYVGSMKPHKNVELLFQVLSLDVTIKLIIVTSDLKEAQQLAQKYHVEDQITLLSGLTDHQLAGLYRSAHALLMPSRREGFGLPAAESLACGTTVVFWGGCHSVQEISSGRAIALTSHSDPQEWLGTIKSLMSTPRLSLSPSSPWLKRYFWDTVAEKVQHELIRQLK